MSQTPNSDAVVSVRVEQERGQWAVLLDVVFPDSAVRHHIGTYHTRARAELAARVVKATADRDPRGNWGMT